MFAISLFTLFVPFYQAGITSHIIFIIAHEPKQTELEQTELSLVKLFGNEG